MKRVATGLIFAGAVAATVCFFRVRSREAATGEDSNAYSAYFAQTDGKDGRAPISLWHETSPEQAGRRVQKAARLVLVGGEILIDGRHLSKEQIKEFLDDQVSKGAIDYVILFPSKGAKWMEVFPVLDECRKSRVKIVLLNVREV